MRRRTLVLAGSVLFLVPVLALLLVVLFARVEIPVPAYDGGPVTLPSADVNGLLQDSQGYIWFVIFSSGLARYDGVSLDVYGLDDGLRDLTLWNAIEDKAGRLWVTSNAGLVVSARPLNEYDIGERVQFVQQLGDVALVSTSIQQNAVALESLTPVLIHINRHYGCKASGIRITGLPE